MSHELDLFLHDSAEMLEIELKRYLPISSLQGSENLNQAICYALFPGGKRMRPLFTLLAAHAFGGQWRRALPVACAIEYLHACSLVLDDLPCMDNASERRGKTPTHRAFGESTAILAAVALLNRAWILLCQQDLCPEGAVRTRRLLEEASCCIGLDGIIGGQFFDLSIRKRRQSLPESLLKTTTLTRFTLSSGAIVADAPKPAVEALARFGQELGAAYQMLDDVVDVEEDALIGPTANRALLLDQARYRLNQATGRLARFFADDSASLLLEYTQRVFSLMIGRATEYLASEIADIENPRPPLYPS
jgi:geranylgeranyl diphosphate synthase type II